VGFKPLLYCPRNITPEIIHVLTQTVLVLGFLLKNFDSRVPEMGLIDKFLTCVTIS
jgi:hypothetical protein